MEQENNNSPVSNLARSTAEIIIEDDDHPQEFEDVCSEIFTELVECWIEKNALRLFAQTQENLVKKPALKKQKSNFEFPRKY